mgnify:CR=1 FL=1
MIMKSIIGVLPVHSLTTAKNATRPILVGPFDNVHNRSMKTKRERERERWIEKWRGKNG